MITYSEMHHVILNNVIGEKAIQTLNIDFVGVVTLVGSSIICVNWYAVALFPEAF